MNPKELSDKLERAWLDLENLAIQAEIERFEPKTIK